MPLSRSSSICIGWGVTAFRGFVPLDGMYGRIITSKRAIPSDDV